MSKTNPPPPPTPRRRRQQRYPYVTPLDVKCSSWSRFRELFTLNVAHTGLFIPTDRLVSVGESALLRLRAPDGSAIHMTSVVRHVLTAEAERPAGIGVEVVDVAPVDRQRFEKLVQRAAEGSDICTIVDLDQDPPCDNGTLPTRAEEATQGGGLFGPDDGTVEPARRQARPTMPVEQPPLRPAAQGVPPEARRSPPVVRTNAPAVVVAIDFGTSRSSVSAAIDGQVTVIGLPGGGWDMPSIVAFSDDGAAMLGTSARQVLSVDPSRAIRSPKRLLGRSHSDRDIEPYLALLPMRHCAGPGDQILLQPGRATYTLPQICAPILFQLKSVAERHLRQRVTQVVLTTPVGFDDWRYEALKAAADLANLEVLCFVDEATAAALAHRFHTSFRGQVAVYDFGGGTFDFSVVDTQAADLKVVATAGDTWLGGDDFDEVLASAAANHFWQRTGIELRHQCVQWQRLLLEAERAKRELSSRQEATLCLPDVALTARGNLALEFSVTRETFSRLSQDIVQRSLATCADALSLSGLTANDLTAIYLSGGTTYIPAVRAATARFFDKPPITAVPPERAVVTGAAIYGSLYQAARI